MYSYSGFKLPCQKNKKEAFFSSETIAVLDLTTGGSDVCIGRSWVLKGEGANLEHLEIFL